jgi:hypothetical protein
MFGEGATYKALLGLTWLLSKSNWNVFFKLFDPEQNPLQVID